MAKDKECFPQNFNEFCELVRI